jgi:hypothetical protein
MDLNHIATKADIMELKAYMQSFQVQQPSTTVIPEWVHEDKLVEQGYSKRTLKTYRDNRQITYTKFGKKLFYKVDSVGKILSNNQTKAII